MQLFFVMTKVCAHRRVFIWHTADQNVWPGLSVIKTSVSSLIEQNTCGSSLATSHIWGFFLQSLKVCDNDVWVMSKGMRSEVAIYSTEICRTMHRESIGGRVKRLIHATSTSSTAFKFYLAILWQKLEPMTSIHVLKPSCGRWRGIEGFEPYLQDHVQKRIEEMKTAGEVPKVKHAIAKNK